MDKLTEKLEIAKLQEEKARAKRIAEKEMEIARAEGSRASKVCEASRQYPFRAIRLKRFLLDLMKMDVTKEQRSLEKRYPESHWPTNLSNHNLTLSQPHTTQMSHLAAKTAQPTMVKDGTSASQFAPNAASAKMQMNKTFQPHVQLGNFEPPNQSM